jgi:hypothetical protein
LDIIVVDVDQSTGIKVSVCGVEHNGSLKNGEGPPNLGVLPTPLVVIGVAHAKLQEGNTREANLHLGVVVMRFGVRLFLITTFVAPENNISCLSCLLFVWLS